MPSFNNVQLMGNVVRDFEVKRTSNDLAVASMSMAINREWTKDGEKKKEVCFVDVTIWGKQAESAAKYLKKGSPCFVEGRLETQSWEKDGQKRSKLAVVAKVVQFLGGKEKDNDGEF